MYLGADQGDFSPKRVLFSSQSFYPSTGGVSTLLLALSKHLIVKGFTAEALHLSMASVPQSNVAPHSIVEHVVRWNTVSPSAYKRHAIFKEILYQNLHGLIPFRYRSMSAVPGYQDYMELSGAYSRSLRELVAERHIIPFIFMTIKSFPASMRFHRGLGHFLAPRASTSIGFTRGYNYFLKYWTHSSRVIFSTPQYAEVARRLGLDSQKIVVISNRRCRSAFDCQPAKEL